jgi:hypothetical protein
MRAEAWNSRAGREIDWHRIEPGIKGVGTEFEPDLRLVAFEHFKGKSCGCHSVHFTGNSTFI